LILRIRQEERSAKAERDEMRAFRTVVAEEMDWLTGRGRKVMEELGINTSYLMAMARRIRAALPTESKP